MKRITVILALILALAMLAACELPIPSVQPTPAENGTAESQTLPEATESDTEPEPAAATEPPVPEASASETGTEPEPVDQPEETEPPAAGTTVEDLDPDGSLPRIVSDLPGAAEINDDIDGRLGYMLGEDYARLRYEVHTGFEGRVLSVLIVASYEGDCNYYFPYNLDLSDGRWLHGEDLLGLLGIGREEMISAETGIMASEFESRYGEFRETAGPELYDELYGNTTRDENADLDRVWLGDGGILMFAAKIYSFAGAEFYEYPMAAGYMFP